MRRGLFHRLSQAFKDYTGLPDMSLASGKFLTLGGAPTQDLHAATKSYVDNATPLPTIVVKKGSGAGAYHSTTTLADMDSTNLSHTVVVPVGFKLVVEAFGSGYINSATSDGAYWIYLYDGDTYLTSVEHTSSVAINVGAPWYLAAVITGDGASHTVKIRHKKSPDVNTGLTTNSNRSGEGLTRPEMIITLIKAN